MVAQEMQVGGNFRRLRRCLSASHLRAPLLPCLLLRPPKNPVCSSPLPTAPYLPAALVFALQIQARVCEGHVSLVRLENAVLSHSHLGLVMEYASGGSLTQYVMRRHGTRDKRNGLYLTESEARFIFKVREIGLFHACIRAGPCLP